jgi:hypothetical protein
MKGPRSNIVAIALLILTVGAIMVSELGILMAVGATTQNSPPSPGLAGTISLSKTKPENVANVIARLASGKVDKVYVYSAVDIETPVSMTPSILDKVYSEKLEYAVTAQRRQQLVSMLKTLTFSPYEGETETQIGLVLVDSADHWQYTIFCDKFGKLGSIGGKKVKMNEAFFLFVESLFAPLNKK